MEDKDESIDLKELIRIAMAAKKQIFTVVLICTLAAMAVAFSLPKQYESTALVKAKAPGTGGLSAAAGAMAALGIGGGSASPTMGYIELMKSRSVIEPIIAQLDIEPEIKEKMTAKGFVKGNLDIKNTKGTDLIEITGKGKSPEEAQLIAANVVIGFQQLMTDLNKNDQSAMSKFLKDRMAISKSEMEDATKALEKFRQQEKIYIPDEQAKAAMEKVLNFDKMTSEIKVAQDTAMVKLQDVQAQLGKQNAALNEFKLVDNDSIRGLRDSIIAKEISLIDLRQKYTDKHPEIENIKNQIAELNTKLSQEVANSVQAETNTLNPIHAGLVQTKIATQTALLVGEKQLAEIQKLKGNADQEISKLSSLNLEYVTLSRDATIAAETYGMLVKNYEQTRLQEAMDSMDLQIVDAANLQKKPSGPNKRLITTIGGVIGIILAFGYVLFLYSRKPQNRFN